MRNLWYVRQGEKISGPYPAQLIARHVLLGRYKRSDQVSVDQALWVRLEEMPELLPAETEPAPNEENSNKRAWRLERQQAAARWRDERNIPDRRYGQIDGTAPHVRRSVKDRRMVEESAETLALRQRHSENEILLKKKREQFFTTATALILIAFVIVVIISIASPVVPVKVDMSIASADCKQPPKQQVNWRGCDKNGANLAGANLRSANLNYAQLAGADLIMTDLSRASLVGANLTGADLSSATLVGADLHFADMRGAKLDDVNFKGAMLGSAVWVDGKVCGPNSVGLCR
jgi:hypothetical protein